MKSFFLKLLHGVGKVRLTKDNAIKGLIGGLLENGIKAGTRIFMFLL